MVVDDDNSSDPPDERDNLLRAVVNFPPRALLVAVLKKADSRRSGLRQDILFPTPYVVVVENQTEPGYITSAADCTAP